MTEEKTHVLVVCGYSCHLEDNNPHVQGYREYLNRVFRFIQDHHTHMSVVIFCGGFTQQKTAPGVSEAGLMCEYTQANHFMSKVVIENESFTTFANIKNSAHIILNKLAMASCRITIFCEATRSANVMMCARHFMGHLVDSMDDITVETASWEQANPFRQAGNLIYNKLAITFPWLRLAELERYRRMRRANRI